MRKRQKAGRLEERGEFCEHVVSDETLYVVKRPDDKEQLWGGVDVEGYLKGEYGFLFLLQVRGFVGRDSENFVAIITSDGSSRRDLSSDDDRLRPLQWQESAGNSD